MEIRNDWVHEITRKDEMIDEDEEWNKLGDDMNKCCVRKRTKKFLIYKNYGHNWIFPVITLHSNDRGARVGLILLVLVQ